MANAFDPSNFDSRRTKFPEITVANNTKLDDIVVGVIGPVDAPRVIGVPEELNQEAKVQQALSANGLSCADGKITVATLPSARVVAVGLGSDADVSSELLRQGAGTAMRFIASGSYPQPRTVAISFAAGGQSNVQAITEGALLGCYSFSKLSAELAPLSIEQICLLDATDDSKLAVERGKIIAQAVAVARDWVNLPPNFLYPESFADQARGYLKDTKAQVSVLDEKALEKQGFGGILAVGGGSVRPPRLVIADYRPREAKKHLVLIGKGITFDSGGYNLKPGSSMITMKCDMSGAADVIAAIGAIARLGLNVHVSALAPMAESMVSGQAYRPSDVLTIFDGTTVENANSDAEGRIVLADAIARASQDKPDMIIDVATLTGACVNALGNRTAGLFANSDASADRVLDAASVTGETFWQLPILDDVRKNLDSAVADLKSSGTRAGGLVFSAAFLEKFVGEGIEWAHLDIAGPAWADEAHDYVSKEGTGMSVRTLIEVANQMSK